MAAAHDPSDGTVDPRQIDAALLGQLSRHTLPLLVTSLGAVMLMTGALWHSAERGWLLVWALACTGWSALRFALAGAATRTAAAPAERRRLERQRLGRAAAWRPCAGGAALGGVVWGSSALLLTGLPGDTLHLIAPFVMAALSAIAVAGFAYSGLAFTTFFYPAVLPYGALLIVSDSNPAPLTAAFVFFWCGLMGLMAAYFNAFLRQSAALSIANARLVDRLTDARDRAEAASLAKTRFLGNMSHELRTPLNAIIGYSEVMARRILGPLGTSSYESYAWDIHRSGQHLLDIVNRVFELSSLEAGRADLAEDCVDMASLVRGTCAQFARRARAHGIDLETNLPDDLPVLRGDAVKLRQILAELVSNAIRYTSQNGHVSVTAGATQAHGMRLVVADNGPGICREDLSRVMEPFALLELRDHTARRRDAQAGGGPTAPGLGLALVGHLARLHGGTVTVRSRAGEGTRVVVGFPAERLVAAGPSAMVADARMPRDGLEGAQPDGTQHPAAEQSAA
ncbi:MAG: HAMP domain-containing histidine kinase [Alphaproteobacteria bacterium]|nr:HAMP domain-containing histidine kinase [Alphaproteobacteria bacterium]MDX5369676.1 HAMP domain-containing histidine kinase [Alphaproteobacteria bacterium]MDX5464311.1 HAMP domain-containing histidine kinase [Alphaproteobacteria bacterium]